MTFDEMQLILQQVVISQREIQASQREFQQEFQSDIAEIKALAQSNSRTIQAMLEQSTTDKLRRDEERSHHETRMERLERISEALANMLVATDEDRPTILRKLNTIERNTDTILNRLPPN
jgi:vacuolar-type H+-ATPase subunit E/Vma4